MIDKSEKIEVRKATSFELRAVRRLGNRNYELKL